MRVPELWTWLDGVPGPKYTTMMANDALHRQLPILDKDTTSDGSFFSVPEEAVICQPSPAIPSSPTPSSAPASTASILSPGGNLLTLLQHALPPIYCNRDVRLPESVRVLRAEVAANFGHGVIPLEFKKKLESLDPDVAQETSETAFKATPTPYAEEFWSKFVKIQKTALESGLNGEDENRWAGAIVSPVLDVAVEGSILLARSVQSQVIDQKIQPHLQSKTRIAKKVDFVLGFDQKHPAVNPTLKNITRLFPDLNIGLTKNSFMERVPSLCAIEVKAFGEDELEGYSQLVIGMSSLLERNKQLQAYQGWPMSEKFVLPVVGILVSGHNWSTYIAFRGVFNEEERTYVEGPIESIGASTRSVEGVCKLIDLIRRVSTYAEKTYWPWLRKEILSPITEMT